MAYTPQINQSASATLRRIAWSVNKPMTKTMNAIILKLPKLIEKENVCKSCRDPSACHICGFNGNEAA
mgnify:CR=1 FL=1